MKTREYLALTAEDQAKRLLNGSGGLDVTDSTLKERQEARSLQMAAFDYLTLNEDKAHREIHELLVSLVPEAEALAEELMSDTERKTAIASLCFRYADVYKRLVVLEPDNVNYKRHHFDS